MGTWMKEWGQFIILLLALGGFYGFIRGDIARVEARVVENQQAIIENRRAISDLGREVSELRGELKGRDLIAAGDR